MSNMHADVVAGFGDQWSRLDQSSLADDERLTLFNQYFDIFPWDALPDDGVGFDLGCGTGRWARIVADRVSVLHCIEPSGQALAVAKSNLEDKENCVFHLAGVEDMPLDDGSMDFGYALGVLHYVPDASAGVKSCVSKLKPGAPFLLYLYYALENRPRPFQILWKASDGVRRVVSRLPMPIRYRVSESIAAGVYFPLARFSKLLERTGRDVRQIPLSAYRNRSFYTMRTDALDRFGTRNEHRFTAAEIKSMMEDAGLERIRFSDSTYWCAVGYKSSNQNGR